MKRVLSGVLAGIMILATGCTGPFALTKKVHNWQTSAEDKWIAEAKFLGCVILPVYGIATLADAVVFNSVEFWTGENPMDASLSQDGENVKMVYREDGSILIQSDAGNCILEKGSEGVSALDESGNLLYTATTAGNQVQIRNPQGELVRSFSKS